MYVGTLMFQLPRLIKWYLLKTGAKSQHEDECNNNMTNCGHYSRVATIKRWLLLKGGYYSGVATIQGWLPLKSGYY